MDTELSIEQILLGLRNSTLWNKRNDIMIPNFHGAFSITKPTLLSYPKAVI